MNRLELLLAPPQRLGVGDSVGAILTVGTRGYLLQQRDVRPGIFFPGFLSLFGGALEDGEEPQQGLQRELREELELEIECETLMPFGAVTFDWTKAGLPAAARWFFHADISSDRLDRLKVHEGQGLRVLTPAELFGVEPVSPIDAFALWFHICAEHVTPAASGGPT
jgi:8-oxo-dGTP pyrophosphatase MutT (NUDIX family)